jgi:hypothetical protein
VPLWKGVNPTFASEIDNIIASSFSPQLRVPQTLECGNASALGAAMPGRNDSDPSLLKWLSFYYSYPRSLWILKSLG